MTKQPEVTLRHNLKTLLATRRLSMSELSRQTGIAKQVISDWLAGSHPKNLYQVKLVASYFDLTIDDLCFQQLGVSGAKVIGHFSGVYGGRAFTVRILDEAETKSTGSAEDA